MTQRRYRPLIGGLFLLAMIGVISVVLIGFARDPDAVSGGPVPTRPPTQDPAKIMPATLPAYISLTPPPFPSVIPTPHYASVADGVRGIVPSVKSTDAKTPTYAEQDVRNYFAQRGITATTSGATLVSITFQTVAQANQSFGESSLRFPGDMLVCVALVKGDYSQPSKTANGYGPPTMKITRKYYVFDGHTGNVLMTRTAP